MCANDSDTGIDPSVSKTEMKKTELREALDRGVPVGMGRKGLVDSVAQVAHKAAMTAIASEVGLYMHLIKEATGKEKLDLVDRLAELKLRATGIVLASMQSETGPKAIKTRVEISGKYGTGPNKIPVAQTEGSENSQ